MIGRIEQLIKKTEESSVSSEEFMEAIGLLNKHGHYLAWAPKYSEPGYSVPDGNSVFFANWNDPILEKFGELAELLEHAIEWHDEWTTCDECGGAYRKSPDSHGWKMYGVYVEGQESCGDCILNDPAAYLYTIEGKPGYAITIDGVDPAEHGYAIVNSEPFEYGVHGGQDASPEAIFDTLEKYDVRKTAVFLINDSSQFSLSFSLYVREGWEDAAREALRKGKTTCDVDPRVAMEQGLKAAVEATKAGAVS
tara:strand:- start:1046 stop:1798 length:753 start_codon:yes stop_codon:yes gene_type:complete